MAKEPMTIHEVRAMADQWIIRMQDGQPTQRSGPSYAMLECSARMSVVPLAGLEPTHLASEASALSSELQGPGYQLFLTPLAVESCASGSKETIVKGHAF